MLNRVLWEPQVKVVTLATAATACALLTACGASGHHASARPRPVQACLQLHDYELHVNGQGITRPLQRRLMQETHNTHLGVDIAQWLQDLNAPKPSSSSGALKLITQLSQDAAAVAQDCDGYGVRNTLPGG